MNCIKKKEWCNNVDIFLKPFAPDIHIQNDKAEKFGQLIIKKVCTMRLSVNVLYKLLKKIVAIATYLYNQIP